MRKYTLSKSDTSEIVELLRSRWPQSAVPKKPKTLQAVELEEKSSILIGEDLLAIKIDDQVLPLLAKEDALQSFPSVTVDMGAVKFVCNGANVMRPGIVGMDRFKKDEIVVVKESTYGKYLAVGLALVDSEEAEKMGKGPVVENRHHVSDEFWKAYKENP
ncbi:MAG: PUA domain-containing protein [Nitrososphaerales archaeon]